MQIASNRRLAFMAGQRDSRLIHAHSKSRCHNRLRFGRPFSFQGESRWLSDPGLKPWAKISNRFAAKSDGLLGYPKLRFAAKR